MEYDQAGSKQDIVEVQIFSDTVVVNDSDRSSNSCIYAESHSANR